MQAKKDKSACEQVCDCMVLVASKASKSTKSLIKTIKK